MARRTVTSALTAALKAVQICNGDAAAVELARRYAQQLDAPGCPECGGPGDRLDRLGPKLLATLTALGMTPAARAAVAKGGTSGPASTPLDELRARRDARQHRAAAVDSAAG